MTDEELYAHWDREHSETARAEGWAVFDCWGSQYGRYQVQRFDEADSSGLQLDSDTSAWRMILRGTRPHHHAVFKLMMQINPDELWWWGQVVCHDHVHPDFIPALVAAALKGEPAIT